MSRGKILSPWPLLALAFFAWFLTGPLGFGLLPRTDPSGTYPATFPTALLAASDQPLADKDYTFLPFRRGLWVIHRPTSTIRYYSFPESSERNQVIESSRPYTIDTDDFPLDTSRVQLSERNLTNYLWLFNRNSGKARFVKARRDGILDESPLLNLGSPRPPGKSKKKPAASKPG